MHPHENARQLLRRDFLTSSASGLGGLALAALLQDELQAEELRAGAPQKTARPVDPLAAKLGHFAPRAKSCIFIFLEGAPSQIDLFDPKPKLVEMHGQQLPKSMTEKVRFAFIQKESAVLMGSPRKFTPHGHCGMELSDYLPHLATCADDIALVRSMHTNEFNHHPGQLMMNTGVGRFGRPSIGAWLTYGLGSESRDLPGYVVLTAGRGTSAGTSNWSSGFLPSTYQGVLFRSQGEPVLNLNNPPGVTRGMQLRGLESLVQLNAERLRAAGDPEIASRVASYELAFRMQQAAPELTDLSGETQRMLDAYGVNRGEPKGMNGGRGGGVDVHNTFARNCLMARRLVERGVRFINLYHASWDHHSTLDRELAYNCSVVDQPIGALLTDLKARGLLESTLVVFAGEFGRTPLAENRGGNAEQNTGRDHHPFAFSLWAAGGGIRGGTVLGKTDEIGWNIVEDPVHINDFHATLLHLFGIDHLKLTKRFGGLDIRLTDLGGKVVKKLLA